jgi:hypothetical protein
MVRFNRKKHKFRPGFRKRRVQPRHRAAKIFMGSKVPKLTANQTKRAMITLFGGQSQGARALGFTDRTVRYWCEVGAPPHIARNLYKLYHGQITVREARKRMKLERQRRLRAPKPHHGPFWSRVKGGLANWPELGQIIENRVCKYRDGYRQGGRLGAKLRREADHASP